MSNISTFEILPDEVILHVCQYLRSSDVLFSFFNLNTRLNTTITGYCHYVNLMVVSHRQFDYVVSYILPNIGYLVRSFVLNLNWQTIMSSKGYAVLFKTQMSIIFPQLKSLTLKSFTTEDFMSYINNIEDHAHIVKLDIQSLAGDSQDTLLGKILAANSRRLTSVTFDQNADPFSIANEDELVFYPNIQELTINLTQARILPYLLKLVPNIRRLHVNFKELSMSPKMNNAWINISPLLHLVDFQLRSIELFWTFDEITDVLRLMPSLQRLKLDLRTQDKYLIQEETLFSILPSSLEKIYFFIRYYYSESNFEMNTLSTSWSTNCPINCMLENIRDRILLHTVPMGLNSIILSAAMGKHMLSGWKYAQQVKDLWIHDASSFNQILLILQHFRHIRSLKIYLENDMESGEIFLSLVFQII